MKTGLMYAFRFYDFTPGQGNPELTDNDFYCKDYIHEEYINFDPVNQRILPFGVKLTGSDAAYNFNPAAVLCSVICNETGAGVQITLPAADWEQYDYNGARYIINKAETNFTLSGKILPGFYHLFLTFELAGGPIKSYYSDTFKLNKLLQ